MDLALEYFNELKELDDFKKLINLKKLIDMKYQKEIISFKTAESFYLESKDNKYYPNRDDIKKRFIEAKRCLYSKEEVKRYFDLQNKLDEILKNDFNEIRESISLELTKNNKCVN